MADVLVVDDGSRDGTAAAAKDAGAECLSWPLGRGKGAALQAGLQWLWERGYTHAVTLDGDGQHASDDIPILMECAHRTEADLVVGQRRFDAMPAVRRTINALMSACLSRLAGMDLPDSQCGFRLVNLERVAEVAFRTRHFEFESELLLAFARAGWRIEFVPIQTIYRQERSKIRPLADTWRWVRWGASECGRRQPPQAREKCPFDTPAVRPYNASHSEEVFRPKTRKVKIYGD